MADSLGCCGARPLAKISAAFGLPGQLSLTLMSVPSLPLNSKVGSWSGSATPKTAREGPIPRMIMRLASLPSIMKPAISTLSPASTRKRVEILARCELDVGVAVGVGEGIGVAVAIGVAVGVAAGLAVGVGLAVALGVAIGVELGTAVAVRVGP